ncbi:MAG TPA: thiamine phosphate synthase [Gemmatimonadales bacterium]|nr:thiamine phosphate synthase [Gemmatimonadales bacterium]
MRPPLPRLHALTDERIARRADLTTVARALAAGGGAAVALHARGRTLTGLQQHRLALCFAACLPARLFVNDRLDVALAAGAWGVQLAEGSLAPGDARRLNPAWWIGQSVHDRGAAAAARTAGADYLVVGAVYRTATHPGRTPLGVAAVAEIAALGLPVIAVGGVTAERVGELRAAGVHGVAAIRAVWDADDPAAAARRIVEELER